MRGNRGGFVTEIVYITYNPTTEKKVIGEILSRLDEKSVDYTINFHYSDIITKDWHFTAISLFSTRVYLESYRNIDYICNNWRNDIYRKSDADFEICLGAEQYVKKMSHPKTEWVDIDRLKELLGVV